MKWTKEKIKLLIDLYPNTPNYELINVFDVTEKSLTAKAYRLNLKKTKECKSFLIGKRNKMVGRDLNYNNLKLIASKYKSRSEFQLNDSSAYSSARIKGYLDDICSHMISKSFSIPQMIMKNILDILFKSESNYNDRKFLKPYEIDLYYPKFNLGFEYNGSGWHKNNKNDSLKRDLAIKKGITLITIHENNRNYILDIKTQIKENMCLISKITNISLDEKIIDDILINNVYQQIYDKEDLMNIAKSYNSKKEFRENDRKNYDKLYKMGLLNESFKQTIKK